MLSNLYNAQMVLNEPHRWEFFLIITSREKRNPRTKNWNTWDPRFSRQSPVCWKKILSDTDSKLWKWSKKQSNARYSSDKHRVGGFKAVPECLEHASKGPHLPTQLQNPTWNRQQVVDLLREQRCALRIRIWACACALPRKNQEAVRNLGIITKQPKILTFETVL